MKRSRYSVLITVGLAAALATAGDPARDRRRTPIVEVFEQCNSSVVNISTTRVVRMRALGYGSRLDEIFNFGRPRPRHDRRVESVGSGVIVHDAGYIVTNAHVVSQASDIQVTFADGSTKPASVVAADAQNDLAVLRVTTRTPLEYQELGRSSDIMIGETVVAIGNPLGLQHTVTRGIVSALGRELTFANDVVYRDLIQTDAPINPGNSGGPLLNVNGELIGINTAIRGDAQNIGFAIPVDRLWELLPALLDVERRERVRFGLDVSGADATVTAVRPNSPAAKAGLAPGDHLTSFNGQALRDGIDYYVRLLDQKPDSSVRLAVRRGSQELDLTVPLQSIPVPDGQKLAGRLLGLQLEEVSEHLWREHDLPDYARLIVESTERRGPADEAGIKPLDLILRVDSVPVQSLRDVGLALEQVTARDLVNVEGLRLDARHSFFWSATLRAQPDR